MRFIYKTRIYLLGVLLLLIGACTNDFVEMNINPNAATTVPGTNVLGQSILSTCYTLFGERLDIYYAGAYAGYSTHVNLGDYEYRVGINNSMWKGMYSAMTYADDAMNLAKEEENNNLYAAALTLKAYIAHKTSDMWGRIPYSEAFMLEDGVIYPKYDTEEEIYTQILSELKTAAD